MFRRQWPRSRKGFRPYQDVPRVASRATRAETRDERSPRSPESRSVRAIAMNDEDKETGVYRGSWAVTRSRREKVTSLQVLPLHCPLSRLFGLRGLGWRSGGPVASNKTRRQLRSVFIRIVLCNISVPSYFIFCLDCCVALSEDSVENILRGLRVTWICRAWVLSCPVFRLSESG